MKFEYIKIRDQHLPGNFAYLPLIDINLGENKIPVKCLIDSGSPLSIIHSPLAVASGIIPSEGKKETMSGIGGEIVSGYLSEIEFSLYSYSCKTKAFLTAELQTPYCLLGQIGFFDRFKVIFNLNNKIFEVNPI